MIQESVPMIAEGNLSSMSQRRARNVFSLADTGALPYILVAALLAIVLLTLYASSLRSTLIFNDLQLVNVWDQAPYSNVFTHIRAQKHFLPINETIMYVQSNTVGDDPFVYHAVVLLLGLLSAVLLVIVGWQLTGHFGVAALGGLVFVAYGTNWEPYLRAAAGSGYISATA